MNVIDPYALDCSLELDIHESRDGVSASTVRVWDKHRHGPVARTEAPIRSTAKFANTVAARRRMAAARTTGRVISSGRP